MKYPRLLVIGQSVNNISGGGITLTNLLKNWPKDKLAFANSDLTMSSEMCAYHYIIGLQETKKIWPFKILQNNLESGIRGVGSRSVYQRTSHTVDSGFTRKRRVKKYLKSLFNYLGIFLIINKIMFSKSLEKFIDEYDPEIIYTQLASLELINLILEIIRKKKIPVVVHIMDDWPLTINSEGIMGCYWNFYTQRRFRKLLKLTSANFAISEAMADEYSNRYGGEWQVFHNTVDCESSDIVYTPVKREDDFFRIGYFGRIGTANSKSLIQFSEAIIRLSQRLSISFDIYTPDYENYNPGDQRSVTVKRGVEYSKVHSIMSQYDLLLLPLDFDENSIRFAKYSMPTKFIDYLCSGVPILVFAPAETAIVKYARKHQCAFCITSNESLELIAQLEYLYKDRDIVDKHRKQAKEIYYKYHTPEIVRERFRAKILSLT